MHQSSQSNQSNQSNQASNRLLRLSEVNYLTGLSRSYIYALSSAGKFPKSISLVPGGTSKAWLESEILAWINERVAAR